MHPRTFTAYALPARAASPAANRSTSMGVRKPAMPQKAVRPRTTRRPPTRTSPGCGWAGSMIGSGRRGSVATRGRSAARPAIIQDARDAPHPPIL